MTDNPSGDFFISDVDDPGLSDATRLERIVVPASEPEPRDAVAPPEAPAQASADAMQAAVAGSGTDPAAQSAAAPAAAGATSSDAPFSVPAPAPQDATDLAAPVSQAIPAAAVPYEPQQVEAAAVGPAVRIQAAPSGPTREQRLAEALDTLMQESPEIEAAALVSLDGFTMASALPDGMHEDRVGAMSAAILGLGERAAAELGRGKLSQVFIQGDGGYVLLTAAGTRAVLTCLADENAKLGLIIYDMRGAASAIGEILG